MLLEATVLADKPKLSIAIFKMENQSVIVVENSTKEASIDVAPLKQRGFSTKGTGSRFGLGKYRERFSLDTIMSRLKRNQHNTVLSSYCLLHQKKINGDLIRIFRILVNPYFYVKKYGKIGS
ncbi:MAG: hypothetical protein ACLS9T_06930 [Streptococcus salivarius]